MGRDSRDRRLWEELAEDWDAKMGTESNRWHRELVRPTTLRLLAPGPEDFVLDAACGNGNFTRQLAALGARVLAFDYSPRMIGHARERCGESGGRVEFVVADAGDAGELRALARAEPFTKAVSNMAVMDIADIGVFFRGVHGLLAAGGIFVFSTVHPCFQTPGMRKTIEVEDYRPAPKTLSGIVTFEYIEPRAHEVLAFANVDKPIVHFHRPLHLIVRALVDAGFVLDALEEPVFAEAEDEIGFEWSAIPPVLIVRARKAGDGR